MLENPRKKEGAGRAVFGGVALIFLVAIITLMRPYVKDLFTKEDTVIPQKIELPSIDAEELKRLVSEKKDVKIIDIRGENYFKSGHIILSANVPLEKLKSGTFNLPTGQKLVIVGYETNSNENQEAFNIIKRYASGDVVVLENGIESWVDLKENLISEGNPASFSDQAKVNKITLEEMNIIIEKEKDKVFIIDVRQISSFSLGHIPGAVNIPSEDLEKNIELIPFGKEVIVYGDTDIQSFASAVKVYDLGFYAVSYLRGGFSDWKTNQLTIESSK